MLTYVINTSENKTLDSNRLFELSGYNRICWMNCRLDAIHECAEDILRKTNTVFSSDFRITILVDFFDFKKIRTPYSIETGRNEEKVDLAVYLPLIEAYLTDHVFGYLERNNVNVADCSIIFIHNGNYDEYYQIYNEEYQWSKILTGRHETADSEEAEAVKPASEDEKNLSVAAQLAGDKDEKDLQYPAERFEAFDLYCNDGLSLKFRIADYPYVIAKKKKKKPEGEAEEETPKKKTAKELEALAEQEEAEAKKKSMNFDEFYHAFLFRRENHSHINKHHYAAEHTGSLAGVAYDTLVLSLCLIHAYEREDTIVTEQINSEVISSNALRDVLEKAWQKIRAARRKAKANNAEYYELEQFLSMGKSAEGLARPEEPDIAHEDEKEDRKKRRSFEWQYSEVLQYCSHQKGKLTDRERGELDTIVQKYLEKRNETREEIVKDDFERLKAADVYHKTNQFPSKEKYEYLVSKKKGEISRVLDRALKAEYLNIDFSENRKEATECATKYRAARKQLSRNALWEVLALILSVLAMLVPYGVLQLKAVRPATVALLGVAALLFAGIFVLAAVLRLLPIVVRLRCAKSDMKKIYRKCVQKHRALFSDLRQRYQKDLIEIEESTYELRQLKRFYEENVNKDKNIKSHRELLEDVEDQISAILNNLGVEPMEKEGEDIEGQFNINRSFRSAENKVYRVFSLEAIESMFTNNKEGKLE